MVAPRGEKAPPTHSAEDDTKEELDAAHRVAQNEESSKYWRICAATPAVAGVAMLVPDMATTSQVCTAVPEERAENVS